MNLRTLFLPLLLLLMCACSSQVQHTRVEPAKESTLPQKKEPAAVKNVPKTSKILGALSRPNQPGGMLGAFGDSFNTATGLGVADNNPRKIYKIGTLGRGGGNPRDSEGTAQAKLIATAVKGHGKLEDKDLTSFFERCKTQLQHCYALEHKSGAKAVTSTIIAGLKVSDKGVVFATHVRKGNQLGKSERCIERVLKRAKMAAPKGGSVGVELTVELAFEPPPQKP